MLPVPARVHFLKSSFQARMTAGICVEKTLAETWQELLRIIGSPTGGVKPGTTRRDASQKVVLTVKRKVLVGSRSW